VSLEGKLDRVVQDPASENYARLMKEYADLSPVVEQIEAVRQAESELADLNELREDPEQDPDMRALAEEEFGHLKECLPALERKLRVLLLPKHAADDRNVILEVRAGTGGDEAGLFAADLFRMYQRYAELRGWRFELIGASETGIGAYKEASAAISGKGVFARLKFESGVHRVQRVPVTESGGRIHTSAATVAVLAEPEAVDIEVEDKDLRIDTYRSQGAGGQHVNTTDSAVRITHLPSGRAACEHHRQRGAHHPSAERHRRDLPGREIAAQEPGQGDEGAARPPLRRRAPGAGGCASGKPARPGR
jgi:peptide chain release factor 1